MNECLMTSKHKNTTVIGYPFDSSLKFICYHSQTKNCVGVGSLVCNNIYRAQKEPKQI